MSVFRRAAALSTAFAALFIAPHQALSGSASEFYNGRTVTVLVGFGAGGGYDAYGRLLAAHMGKHLPGNPTVIAKNMAGAGSLLLANYLYNAAPKDGTAIGIVAATVAFAPLIGPEKTQERVKYDPRKFNWIGSLNQFTPIGISWKGTGIRTLDDARERVVKFGSSGSGSGGEPYARLMNQTLGTRFEPIRGYRGSRDISRAMEQGEVPAFIGWCWTCLNADKPHWVKNETVNVFVQLGLEKNPAIPDVPFAYGQVTDEEDKKVWQLILSNLYMARPFAAPPGVPGERVKALREAFVATARDPAFLAAAEKAGRSIKVYDGNQIQELLERTYTAPEPVVRRATAIMSGE